MSPTVSVIVPVHNVEAYLDECLASIAAQTYVELDVILIDDGSTDGSGQICSTWVVRDARFRLFHQQNQGSSVARNLGIETATGDFITFVDSDDLLEVGLVEHLVGLAEAHDADAVISRYAAFDSRHPPEFALSQGVRVADGATALHEIVCLRPQWGTPAKLYRREVLAGLRFPPGLRHQDLWLAPRAFDRIGTAVLSEDARYGYRQRDGSIMDEARRELSRDLITVLTDNIEFARTAATERFHALLIAYVLHASKSLERLSGPALRRSRSYRRAYRAFMARYLPEVRAAGGVSAGYWAALTASRWSPTVFHTLFGTARWLKGTIAPGLRRMSGQRPTRNNEATR